MQPLACSRISRSRARHAPRREQRHAEALAGLVLGGEHHVLEHASFGSGRAASGRRAPARPGDRIAARACDAAPAKRTAPRSGRMNPETRLKTVVLPAPFGPISAVIEPSATPKLSVVDGRDAAEGLAELLEPRGASPPYFSRRSWRRSPRMPCGRKRHEQHEQQADQEEPKEGARAGIEERQREEVEEARAGDRAG